MKREVVKLVTAQETSDGAGVRLRRSIGTRALMELDPFLLLDEFKSDDADDYIAGFPDHPHRGFETVTYMLAGEMEHRDHRGHHGRLVAGSVQWMTAGRGIVHSEMPRQKEGLMWGFQLWVNLPARDKLCDPRYQEFPPEAIPVARPAEGVEVRVIAGETASVRGAVSGIVTRPLYLDVELQPQASFSQPVPADHAACVYVFKGKARLGSSEEAVSHGHLAVLGEGTQVAVQGGEDGVRLLLLAARPLAEPVARHGPFVMNTRAEIQQAMQDYQDGTLTG